MKRIRIIQRYFNEAEAKKMATFQRRKLKETGTILFEVQVKNAFELYNECPWFRKKVGKTLGIPSANQRVVLVIIDCEQPVVPVANNLVEVKEKSRVIKMSLPKLKKAFPSIIKRSTSIRYSYAELFKNFSPSHIYQNKIKDLVHRIAA